MNCLVEVFPGVMPIWKIPYRPFNVVHVAAGTLTVLSQRLVGSN